jgi:uncharacterized membrane protein YbhN (UPF0104 family)
VASVADRFIDTMTNVAFIALALPFAGLPETVEVLLRQAGAWFAVGIAGTVVIGLIVLRSRKASAARLWQTARELASRKPELVKAVCLSILVQGAFVLINAWFARQVGVTTSLATWFVAWPLSKLVSVLPISLGGIGVREAALVLALSPYGAPREGVLASGILWQAVFIITGILGFLTVQLVPRTPVGDATPSGRKA